MVSLGCKYPLLMASLPPHPYDLHKVSQVPLSRLQLDRRLGLLDLADGQDLQRMERLLCWPVLAGADDRQIVSHSLDELRAIRHPLLRELVAWRLRFRTLMVALRQRQAGLRPGKDRPFVGFGPYGPAIARNWQKPDFGLGAREPWLLAANQLLAARQTYALEKLQLEWVWRHYNRVCGPHLFDAVAVAIYVLRWDISNRWTRHHAGAAVARFNVLADGALAGAAVSAPS